jgi:hypothetical protein
VNNLPNDPIDLLDDVDCDICQQHTIAPCQNLAEAKEFCAHDPEEEAAYA